MNEFADGHLTTDRGGEIFAVDDEETDRLLLSRRLADAAPDCRCRSFASGEELLDALMNVLRGAPPPVACFVDIKMSPMSGLDVLRWIRAQHGLDSIPVVILSSCDAPECLSEAHHLGVQCYVTKFPELHHLREIVSAARRYAVSSGCNAAFSVACNLLANAPSDLEHTVASSDRA